MHGAEEDRGLVGLFVRLVPERVNVRAKMYVHAHVDLQTTGIVALVRERAVPLRQVDRVAAPRICSLSHFDHTLNAALLLAHVALPDDVLALGCKLEGTLETAWGATTLERITWTPLDGGRVRQLWEQSQDQGKTWKSVFDGTYSKKK